MDGEASLCDENGFKEGETEVMTRKKRKRETVEEVRKEECREQE